MILFIFISFWLLAPGKSQYYYTGQPAFYHISTAPRYNQFSQPFTSLHFSSLSPVFSHASLASVQTAPLAPLIPPAPLAATIPTHRNTFEYDNTEHRGFAYYTRTDTGATSHVLFVTGPQAQHINSKIFSNSQIFKQNPARTIASEMVDPIKKTEKEKQAFYPNNIQDLYTQPMEKVENNDPLSYFHRIFLQSENPPSRMINFYSKNTDLFAEHVPNYPPSTAPLNYDINPRSLNLNNIESTTAKQIQNESKINEKKLDSEITAESIITNTRFKINDIISNIKNDNQSESESLPLDSESDFTSNSNNLEEEDPGQESPRSFLGSTGSTTVSTLLEVSSVTTSFTEALPDRQLEEVNTSTSGVVESASHTTTSSDVSDDSDFVSKSDDEVELSSTSLLSSISNEETSTSDLQDVTTSASINLNTDQKLLNANEEENSTMFTVSTLFELNGELQTTESSLAETTAGNLTENYTNPITEAVMTTTVTN